MGTKRIELEFNGILSNEISTLHSALQDKA